jgi:hypothetical protein
VLAATHTVASLIPLVFIAIVLLRAFPLTRSFTRSLADHPSPSKQLMGVHDMSSKNTAVFGIYQTAELAERAVDSLIAAGFSSSAISVLLPDTASTKEFAHHKDTKAPEGTTAGVTAGGVIGGTLGVLAGIGALAIPGVGPLIAAGPIMAGLAGLGVGGAVGGLVGALVGMGIPEYEAKRYEGRVKEGGTLLSVHCDTSEQVSRAKDLLKGTGAADIASTGEAASDKTTSSRVA